MGMIGDLFVKLGLKSDDFNKGIDQAKGKTSEFGSAMGKIGGLIAGAFSIGAIVGFISKMINVRSEFSKYEAVLTNTLGSQEKARTEMNMLQKFAAETPFALSELTGAFVKLTNYGLKPNKDELKNYGDLASSVGKGFDQLVEGIADATTGQFERLKEFGIKASQEGSKVSFVFKGQQTVVENNSQAIKNYIQSLGKLEGVTGSMAAISGTLGGKISNLGDAWDRMLNALGAGTGGIMVTVINWLTSMVEMFEIALKSIKQIKAEVRDTAVTEGMNNAIKEIDVMEKSLMRNGVNQASAHKKAVELYNQSVNLTIDNTKKALETATGVEKDSLQRRLDLLKGEQNAVKDHYDGIAGIKITKTKKQLDDEAKEKKESYDKGVKLVEDATNKEQALLLDKLRNKVIIEEEYNIQVSRLLIAQYEKEKALAKKFGQDIGEIDRKIAEERYKIKEGGPQKMISAKPDASVKYDPITGKNANGEKDPNQLRVVSSTMTDDEKKEAEAMERKKQAMGQFLNDFNGLIQSGMAQAATTFGEGIGALLSGDMNFKDFGKSLLAVVGQFLVQLGQLMITLGIGMTGLKAAISDMNPVLAIGAGIALVAAGSAIASLSKKGLSGSGGGGSASGGGSYVAPSNGRQSEEGSGEVVFKIQGSTLVGVLNNAEKRKLNFG